MARPLCLSNTSRTNLLELTHDFCGGATYTYGTGLEFGQIKTLERKLPNSGGATWDTKTLTFGYDKIYQVLSANEPGATPPTRSFTYDAAGNRLTKVENAVTTTYSTANTINQHNTVPAITGGDPVYATTHDNNGNATEIVYGSASTGSRKKFEWDSLNRLKRVEIWATAGWN